MKLRAIIDSDCNHYKDFTMVLFAPYCTWKCCTECGIPESSCANHCFQQQDVKEYPNEAIINRYISNPLHGGLCIAGAEPLDSNDLRGFLKEFRAAVPDVIIIYTGYTADEPIVVEFIDWLTKNDINDVILKVGRYIPDGTKHIDPILGVPLASENQYAIKVNFKESYGKQI